MARPRKKKPGRPAGKKAANKVSDSDLFDIEKNPPLLWVGRSREAVAIREKIDRTLPHVPPGGAFIIPRRYKNTARKHLSSEYPDQQFTIAKIVDNPDYIRIYLVQIKK